MSVEGSAPAAAVENVAVTAPVEGAEAVVNPNPEPVKSAMDERLGAKFAALTRKEKEAKQLAFQVKAEREAFMKEREEFESTRKSASDKYATLKERMASNPLQALQEEFGLTYDQIIEMGLNDGNPTPEMRMKRMQEELDRKHSSKYEELEKRLADKEKAEAEQQKQALQAHFMSRIEAEISAKPEEYETIAAYGKQHEVYDLMDLVYNNEGRVMDIQEAAQLVEAELLEEVRKEEARILNIKKLKRAQPAATQATQETQTAPTLSNALSSEAPKNGERKLTMEEAKAAAAKLLQWRE